MSDDPRVLWYQNIWYFIRDQAAVAIEADLFASAESMHVNLVGASMEHLIACAETPADLESIVQIIRTAEALTLAQSPFYRPARHLPRCNLGVFQDKNLRIPAELTAGKTT